MSKDLNTDFTLGDCLFGVVKLTRNTDPDKLKYSGCGTEFDSRTQSSWADGSIGKKCYYFWS